MLKILFDNEKVRLSWLDIIIALAFFGFGLVLFTQMYRVQSDMFFHLRTMTLDSYDKKRLFFPSYDALMRLGTDAMALFQRKYMVLGYSALLALLFSLKYLVVSAISLDYFSRRGLIERAESPFFKAALVFLCLASQLLAFPQLVSNYWQADIPRVNVWHNPTCVGVLPFAVLLFYFSFRALEEGKPKYFFLTAFFFFLNAFTKPAYLLPWLPCFFLFFAFVDLREKDFTFRFNWKKLLISLALGIPLALALSFTSAGKNRVAESVVFSLPFALESHMQHIDFGRYLSLVSERLLGESTAEASGAWQLFWYLIYYKPLSLLCGLAFPIAAFFAVRRKKDAILIFSWIALFFSYVIAFFLAEQGVTRPHLNFTWQIPLAVFILFFVSLLKVFSDEDFAPRPRWALAAALGVFLLHAYQGILYLQRLFFTWTFR